MVIGRLGDGINKLATVGDHAAIIGETVLARVVGHGVVWGRLPAAGIGVDTVEVG